MIVICGDIECQHYNPNGCTASAVDHIEGLVTISSPSSHAKVF